MFKNCKNGYHYYNAVYDEMVIKSHDSYKETEVEKTYLFHICSRCGKVIKGRE